jgi:hypothetical protein
MALHGAMAVRGVPRPEAETSRRVRAVVGAGAFLVATFDSHGNWDEDFLRHAVLREILPALRCLSPGPSRRAMPSVSDPQRLKTGTCDGEGADHPTDRAAVDRRVAVDGSGPARFGMGSARAGCLRQRLLRLAIGRCSRCRRDHPGADQWRPRSRDDSCQRHGTICLASSRGAALLNGHPHYQGGSDANPRGDSAEGDAGSLPRSDQRRRNRSHW